MKGAGMLSRGQDGLKSSTGTSIVAIPWRSSRRGGSLCCRSELGRRKGRAPHRSRGSCGPETAWPADTGSDSRLCSHSHQPVVGLGRKMRQCNMKTECFLNDYRSVPETLLSRSTSLSCC